jgi:hypothetical protein
LPAVEARLVEPSRELGAEHQLTLARFDGEHLLYRLSMNSALVARTGDWSEGETAPAALSELAD